jgi:hypothetical protein
VVSNICRCSALSRSVWAPNFQALSRASSNVIFSSLASLKRIGLRVALGLLGARLELGEHARGKFGDGARAQTLKVFGLEREEVDHEHQLC